MKELLLAFFRKASAFAGAFFVSVFFVTAFQAGNAQAGDARAGKCPLNPEAGAVEKVKLKYVTDGDTVRLKDGRKVRFFSINAPETEHDEKPAEAYGDEAAKAVENFFSQSSELLLQKSAGGQDHYGRTLGQLFTLDGASVSAELIRQGLAFQIFMDEPDPYRQCFKRQEALARKGNLGVWSLNPVKSVNNDRLHGGFMLIRGTVKKISTPKKSDYIWLELDGDMVLSLPKAAANKPWLDSLKNNVVEVRGWVVDRNSSGKKNNKRFKRWMMVVYQTDSIKKVE